MLDAPVSGGVGGAQAGTLTFMVGGGDAAFARARPILEQMGKTIVHAGGAGNGQAAKICNNMILGVSMIAVSEAFVLAEKLGLDAQKLFDISSKSSGQCWSMTTYCPVPGPVPTSPANRDYQAGFTAAMMLKDLKLAQDAAKARRRRNAARCGCGENLRRNTSKRRGAARFLRRHPLRPRRAKRSPEPRWNFLPCSATLDGPKSPTHRQEGWMAAAAATSRSGCAAAFRAEGAVREMPAAAARVLRDFTAKELEFVSNFKSGELNVEAGTSILLQSTNSAHLYTVLSGWAFRYKTLPDGRRQILNYAMPSDLLGLQGSVNDEMQHSVEALTDMMLCVFPREKLWDLYTDYPTLAFDVTWLAAREEQILDEDLLSVGRRTAMERLAYLLLTLFQRAEEVGLTKGNSIQFPFTQQHVADTLGMSLVHTNKTLQRLNATKTMRWKERRFEILDREALAKLASYERPEPRARRPFI